MTRITVLDCAVIMCNLINTHTHTQLIVFLVFVLVSLHGDYCKECAV